MVGLFQFTRGVLGNRSTGRNNLVEVKGVRSLEVSVVWTPEVKKGDTLKR